MIRRVLVVATLLSHVLGGQQLVAQSAGSAPTVRILSVRTHTTGRVDIAEVCVVAEGRAEVNRVELEVNGIKVRPRDREGANTGEECPLPAFAFTVPLVPGTNDLQAIAYASNGAVSAPAREVVRGSSPLADRTLHILAVGINGYAGGLSNLTHAESDARAFADSLRKQAQPIFGTVQVQMIQGAAATKDSLAEAFLTLANTVGENDTFVFFFAGHGALASVGAARTFFLASPQVTDLSQGNVLARKAISAPELAIWLSRIPARDKVLLLDTCTSAEITSWCAGNKETAATYRHVLTELGGAAEAAILAATQPSDPAVELGALRHGVFTSALLHNRRPGERPAVRTINDLFTLARDYVRELAFTQGLRDQDLFVLTTPVDFPLFIR